MALFGAISAGIGVAGSIAQGIMGASQASKAKKAIANYKRQKLTNTAEGISISTKGAEMVAKEVARTAATTVSALQTGGVRGVVGGAGKVVASVDKSLQQVTADLDRQEKEKQKMIAQEEVRIQQMTEEREKADLAGLGQQLAVGQQNLMGGIAGLGKSIGQFAGNFGGAGTEGAEATS